jgi:hypothetical protein
MPPSAGSRSIRKIFRHSSVGDFSVRFASLQSQQQLLSKTIQHAPNPGKLLYIDILNYGTYIFPMKADWNCANALGRVEKLVQAAGRSGWSMKAFIDEKTLTAEAENQWRSRREKELRKGIKQVPQGMQTLIGNMLRQCGVTVCYSMEADNDDTLACHAQANNADILSGDKDMFRYINREYTVYSMFNISNGLLSLTPHRLHYEKSSKRMPLLRAMDIERPPAVQHSSTHITDEGVYLRGVPSPLVRALKASPHGVVAPLRHALYAHLKKEGPLVEEWPEWDEKANDVRWCRYEDVMPSKDMHMRNLLQQPDEAMRELFPQESASPLRVPANLRGKVTVRDWHKHAFCVRSVVYELCTMANPDGPRLLDLMLNYELSQGNKRSGGSKKH